MTDHGFEAGGPAPAPIPPVPTSRGTLRPVVHRARWIASGLACQFVGIGAPLGYVLAKAKHEGLSGLLTHGTIQLAWHESLHKKAGIGLLAAGAVLLVTGSVLLARPFVRHWAMLFVAVPAAAVAGGLLMGGAALLVILVVLLADSGDGHGPDGASHGSSGGSGGSGADSLSYDGPGIGRGRKRPPGPSDVPAGP